MPFVVSGVHVLGLGTTSPVSAPHGGDTAITVGSNDSMPFHAAQQRGRPTGHRVTDGGPGHDGQLDPPSGRRQE